MKLYLDVSVQMIDLYKDPRGEGVFGRAHDDDSTSTYKHRANTSATCATESGLERNLELTLSATL